MDCIQSIRSAIEYMENHMLEDITYEDVAKHVYMSNYHFHRLFSMVNSVMNNVPKIYEYIEENERFGYIMENVQGKSLASLMMDGQTFEPAMDMFTRIHKEWLINTSDTAILYTEWMKNTLNKNIVNSDLLKRINNLPKGNTLCHDDFHPYNIIVTPDNQPIVIDFANVCRGPKEYDIARTYVLLKEAIPDSPVAEIYLDKMQIQYSDL